MQPTRLPLSGGSGIEGPVGCGLYNVKAYAVSQRKRETALVSRSIPEPSTLSLILVVIVGVGIAQGFLRKQDLVPRLIRQEMLGDRSEI